MGEAAYRKPFSVYLSMVNTCAPLPAHTTVFLHSITGQLAQLQQAGSPAVLPPFSASMTSLKSCNRKQTMQKSSFCSSLDNSLAGMQVKHIP
jgi:hypothetical protein